MNSEIIKLQERALIQGRHFIKNVNLDNPNLTDRIWSLLNDRNIQINISQNEAKTLKENWSKDKIGELQRVLVDYQLHQMKLGSGPKLFKIIWDVFNVIENKESGYKLLDVGCTSGYFSEVIDYFFPNVFNYNGCDYNSSSVELAKKYYPSKNFFVNDLTNLTINDKEYDITFLSGVIEHVPEYKKGVSELCRVTKKYIVLHRIWLQDGPTTCKKGTQFFVPVIRNYYNKKEFFDILETGSFIKIWESETYDTNCKSYVLKRKEID